MLRQLEPLHPLPPAVSTTQASLGAADAGVANRRNPSLRSFILLNLSRPSLCGSRLGVIARDVAALKRNRHAKQFLAHQGGASSPLCLPGPAPRSAPLGPSTCLSLPNSCLLYSRALAFWAKASSSYLDCSSFVNKCLVPVAECVVFGTLWVPRIFLSLKIAGGLQVAC